MAVDLEVWEITRARQGLRYGIRLASSPPIPDAWNDFQMLNESFGELWLMDNVAIPVRRVDTVPADADEATRWNLLARLEGWIDFTYEEQIERLRRLDEDEERED